MSRILIVFLALLSVVLQYRLWVGDGGILEVRTLRGDVATQQEENARLLERNQALEAEVKDLKAGREAMEERARMELGMVREGETFFRLVHPAPPAPAPAR